MFTPALDQRTSAAARVGVVARPTAVDLLGIPVSVIDYEQALAWIEDTVAARERGFVCVSNVHAVMAAAEDPGLREALLQSSINVPDGMPLVWAMNLLGESLRTRVYGPELMARACARAARSGERFYLYGGRNQGALVQLALNLRQRYPGIKIVGGYSPPHRPLTDEERRTAIEEINVARPDVVWVGIGVPKQEKWIRDRLAETGVRLAMGVGGLFDFYSGRIPRAPVWIRELGMEWFYRFAQEPRRMWRRYFVEFRFSGSCTFAEIRGIKE